MKFLTKVLATAGTAVGATAITLAAALPAGAATLGPSSHGNYETISGFLAGRAALANAPVVPLRLSGAVNARGSINLGGNSTVSRIPTNKGTLTVQHGNPGPRVQLNYRSCRETETISTSYTVIGRQSSGAFTRATGSGRAVVVFSAVTSRYASGPRRGQCNFSNSGRPQPNSAWVTFQAQGPLYLWHR
jgi:hypothetical protein